MIAFSAFDTPVPMGAIFGRSLDPTRDVLCTNPAALRGGSAKLDSVFPSEPFAPGTIIGQATLAVGVQVPDVNTPWIELRSGYRGRCSSADRAHVLQISSLGGAPVRNAVPDPTWGCTWSMPTSPSATWWRWSARRPAPTCAGIARGT